MAFTFFDHTGDIGVDVVASTLDALFADAAAAFLHSISDPAGVRADTRLQFDLASSDLDLLLMDWLSELLFRFETDGFLAARVEAQVTRDETSWRLHAEAAGERGAASRLPIKVLIKAVTYHALEVRRTPAGWSARVVFDI